MAKKAPTTNKGGHPPLYKTPEEFQKKVEEYVEDCKGEYLKDDEEHILVDKYGRPVTTGRNPTLAGLAYFMGFASRQSLYDNEKREGFSYSVSRARLYIEASYEEDLRTPGISPSGITFALKNMGWSDKQEIEHSGGVKVEPIKKWDEVRNGKDQDTK